MTEPAAGVPPVPRCRRDPVRWDTDQSPVEVIRAAAHECVHRCALLGACRRRAADLRADHRPGTAVPELAGMVWAGQAYNQLGVLLDLTAPCVRTGPRQERDPRHVTADGRSYDGHTGRWVTASSRRRVIGGRLFEVRCARADDTDR